MKASAGGEPEEDERWERASVRISPEARTKMDEALSLAGKVLGATAPRWQRIEAICCEYLGAHPEADDGAGNRDGLSRETIESLEEVKAGLEEEMRQWNFLEKVPPVAAPDAKVGPECDPRLLDDELRRLVGLRNEWDEVFGHLAMLLRLTGLWRDMGFVSFGHYCAERLGMAERTVAQRASLARSFYFLPGLREAMRAARLSYEKARLVASCADCSRAAAHVHHIIPRSAGGTDDEWNLVSLCAAHHLHGVHLGWVRVRGRAPDQLIWELGERALAH